MCMQIIYVNLKKKTHPVSYVLAQYRYWNKTF